MPTDTVEKTAPNSDGAAETEQLTQPDGQQSTPQDTTTTEPSSSSETPADDEELWTRLSTFDPDEIIKRFPKLQGKIGALAQRQAERLSEQKAQQRIDEANRARRQAELESLAESDNLLALGAEAKREILTAKQRQAQTSVMAETERNIWINSVDPVLLSLMEGLPPAAQSKIRARYESGDYGSDPVAARKSYFTDVMENYHRAKIGAVRKQWEETELPAKLKEKLGEENGQDSPDLGGTAAPSGIMSQDEFNQHRDDTGWLYNDANWKRFEAGRKSGLITY